MAVVIFTLSKCKPVFLSEENPKEALNSSWIPIVAYIQMKDT